jgi:glycosyltransferase involved in cell wall biosynthesis
MPDPLVSIITPCFNGAASLHACVDSVLRQACDAEVIIIDDGSTDDSPQKARELALSHRDRIILICQTNGGPAAARNAGIRIARGKYIGFLDVDDEYAEGCLSAALQLLERDPTSIAVQGRLELVNLHRHVEPWQVESMEATVPGNVLIRAVAVRQLGGFPTDPIFRGKVGGEDGAFRVELAKTGNVALLDRPYLRYRIRPGDHADFFLDRSILTDGKLAFKDQSPEERDGTLFAAFERYVDQVTRRRLDKATESMRTDLNAAYQLLQNFDRLQRIPGTVDVPEAFALFNAARLWSIEGGVVQLGYDPRATYWLAAGCKVSGWENITVIGADAPSFAPIQGHVPELDGLISVATSEAVPLGPIRLFFIADSGARRSSPDPVRLQRLPRHSLLAVFADRDDASALALQDEFRRDMENWLLMFGIQRLTVFRRK